MEAIKPFSDATRFILVGTKTNEGKGCREDILHWNFHGPLDHAADIMSNAVIRELGAGDNENGGSGSLKNCRGDIFNAFMSTGHYEYADCRFEIIPIL